MRLRGSLTQWSSRMVRQLIFALMAVLGVLSTTSLGHTLSHPMAVGAFMARIAIERACSGTGRFGLGSPTDCYPFGG